MKKRATQGFVLATVIAVMLLLLIVGGTLLLKSTSELKQSSNSEGVAKARGYAEAAQADMYYALASPGIAKINTVFKPYVTAFAATTSNAATTAIVPTSEYPVILSALKSAFPDLTTTTSDGNFTSAITFRALRADASSFSAISQSYYLDYSIVGKSVQGSNTRSTSTEGSMKIALGRISINQFILLANDGGSGTNGTSGFFDTSSVYDGPVHVNQNWALSGSPTFKAGASVSGPSVWMNNSCSGFSFVKVAGNQSSPSGCTNPNTNGFGLQYNTDVIPLPANAQSQARASLGKDASDTSNLTVGAACDALGLAASCGSVPNGTYIPNNGAAVTGGIYVQGDASVTLTSVGNAQVYSILDATGKTTTITVDYVLKTTTYVVGTGLPKVLTGVPNGQLYVQGNITSLTGPPRIGALPNPAPTTSVPGVIQPALNAQSQLNIASSGSVTVQGDVTYAQDPRTTPNATNVLGIIAGGGNVIIGDSAPNDVYLNAAILAGATNKGLSVQSPSRTPARGAIHTLGSLAEDTDQIRGIVNNNGAPVAGYADDFKFDQRFVNGAVAPPFFPSTTQFAVKTGWPIQRTWSEQ